MDRMPIEILCKILSYLETYDLLQFCNAYGSNCFLKESSIIRSVNFQRRYEVENVNFTFITTNFNCAYIKSLNINYVYWISSSELRELLSHLNHLEELRALETCLGLTSQDIRVYGKLKKLAVSVKLVDVSQEDTMESQKLLVLKSLCVCILDKRHRGYYFQQFLRNIPRLEELWISDEDTDFQQINYEGMLDSLTNLKKLVVKSKIPVRCNFFDQHGFSKTFECRRNGPSTELIYEKILSKPETIKESTSDLNQNAVEKSLEMFEVFLHDLPYGPLESKEVCLKKPIENIYFTDLNFCQPVILCNSKYINAAVQILVSKNSTTLKRLRFRSCLFKASQIEMNEEVDIKRSRQASPAILANPFCAIADNVKKLTELEIEICPQCNDEAVISAYSAIQQFESLRRLSLEVPPLMNGSFLKEVFLKCQQLEFLNLTCVVNNDNFITNLYNNLKYAVNLKHFRLEHKDINLDQLLNSLNSMKHKKLLRVFISCDTLNRDRYTNERTPIYKFVNNNPQLVVFFIEKNSNDKQFDNDQELLLKLMKKSIPNLFWFNYRSPNYREYPAHRDLFYNFSNTSVINIDKF